MTLAIEKRPTLKITPELSRALHSNEMWLLHDHGQVGSVLSSHVGYLIDPSAYSERRAAIDRQHEICIQCTDAKTFRHSELSWDVPIQETGLVVIRIIGTLTKYGFFFGGTSLLRLQTLVRMARLDERVTGVLLIFDTPGGSAAGTGDLAAEIALLRKVKPVFGFGQDLCASAGVWLMSQCTKVFCNPTAIIGSVGTIIVMYDSSALFKNEGWAVFALTSRGAELKAAGFAGVEFSEEAKQEWQSLVDTFNDAFVGGIMNGRGMTRPTVMELADGRVHVGPAAVKIGLVDAVKPLDDVIRELTKTARRSSGGVTANLEAIQGDGLMTTETAVSDPQTASGSTPATLPGSTAPATTPSPQPAAAPAPQAAAATTPVQPVPSPKPAASPPVQPQTASRAATVDEINARFPKSSAEFKFACISEKLSMSAAMDKFLAEQASTIARQSEELAKLQPGGGVKAVGTAAGGPGTGAGVDADPIVQWGDLVAQEKKDHEGISNANAIANVVAANSEVHEAYVKAHNDKFGAQVASHRPPGRS